MMDLTLIGFAVATLGVALAMGPLALATRGALRATTDVPTMRRYAPTGTVALGAGCLGAVVLVGVSLGGLSAVIAALLALLVLLIVMDLTWRWLPIEWTIAALVLGLGAALLVGDPLEAVLGAALGGGLLALLRAGYLYARGIEALGLGDVWLAAALGSFVGPTRIGWLLCAAAALGLLVQFLSAWRARMPRKARYGVAFGAHLALLAPFFLTI